ncbi:MAG: RidA family protein [Anaerolineae bacterium]
MTKRIVHSDQAPEAVGPYSQAVVAGGQVYCAGQVALDPVSGVLVNGGIEEQTHQVISNLRAVLEAAGTGLEHVVKTTVFLQNLDEFSAMNSAYAEHFPQEPPARSTVEAARLPRGAKVEIDAIAVLE